MSLTAFLQKLQNNEEISFNETISIITDNYHYIPAEFTNGLNEQQLVNAAEVMKVHVKSLHLPGSTNSTHSKHLLYLVIFIQKRF